MAFSTNTRVTSRVTRQSHLASLVTYSGVPLAFGLSILGSGQRAPWYDEAFTLWASQLTPSSFLDLIRQTDVVYALYYKVIGTWLDLFGYSFSTARVFSALAMAVAAGGVITLARTLTNHTAAMLSGLVFALLPIVSQYGMVARASALSTALVTWATVLFVRAAKRQPGSATHLWISYTLVLLCAGYTFLFSLLIIPAHASTLAWIRAPARTWRNFLTACLVVTLAIAPLVLVALGQRGGLGHYNPPSIQTAVGIPFIWTTSRIAGAILWLIILTGLLVAYRRRQDKLSSTHPSDIGITQLALPWLFLPALILVAVSVIYPIFSPHYVVLSSSALALLVGFAGSQVRPRWVLGLALCAFVLAALPAYLSARSPDGIDGWGLKRDVLVEHALPGDGLLTDPDWYHRIAIVDPVPGVAVLQNTGEKLDPVPPELINEQLHTLERVWLVSRRTRDLGGTGMSLLENAGFRAVEHFEADSPIILYERSGPLEPVD
jgi:mannosyltransferase